METRFAIEDPRTPEVRALVDLLDRDLYSRYPEMSNTSPSNTGPPDLASFTPPRGLFVVARVSSVAVACGALVYLDARSAEVKRMFVNPDHRGRGLARQMLADLEERARGLGCTHLRLETGKRQPEAIALYRSAGYSETAAWAPWENDPLSVCFAKAL